MGLTEKWQLKLFSRVTGFRWRDLKHERADSPKIKLAALLAAAREEGYAAAMREGQAVELHLLEKLEAAREEPRQPPEDVREKVARSFHEAYERLAPQFGYKTREASAVPWEDVPAANKELMRATVGEVLSALPAVAVGDGWRVVPVEPTREMLKAAAAYEDQCAIQNYGGSADAEGLWDAMIQAAPPHGGGG